MHRPLRRLAAVSPTSRQINQPRHPDGFLAGRRIVGRNCSMWFGIMVWHPKDCRRHLDTPRHQASMSMANGQRAMPTGSLTGVLPVMPPEKTLRTRRYSTSPRTRLVRSASRGPLPRTVVSRSNSDDERRRLELARAENVIQTVPSEIAQLGRAQAQHNQMMSFRRKSRIQLSRRSPRHD